MKSRTLPLPLVISVLLFGFICGKDLIKRSRDSQNVEYYISLCACNAIEQVPVEWELRRLLVVAASVRLGSYASSHRIAQDQ